MEFDIFTKTRQPGIIPLAPLSKSLWTCSVEAAIEYCRIVWDIFPTEKLIRFIVSDTSSLTLNSWSQDQQNLNHLMAALAQVGPPQNVSGKECNVIHGLNAAIEALCECSEIQHEKRTSMTESAGKVRDKLYLHILFLQGEGTAKEIHLWSRLGVIVVLPFGVFNFQCNSAEWPVSSEKITFEIHA
ncbi:UNVERIFIED_CONTAM: asun [Trichonephila clavipes]